MLYGSGHVSLTLLTLLLSISLAAYLRARSRWQKLPPGPKGHWFLGNAAQFPAEKPWLWYMQLHKEYGDIVRLTVPGRELILLGTLESVQDLFMGRSAIYSDRGRRVMTGEIVGQDITTILTPYGERWRALRKLWNHHLGAQAVPAYHAMLYQINLDLMKTFHEEREGVHEALYQSLVRTVLMLAYGMDITKAGNEWPERLKTLSREVMETATPGKYLVDAIPALKYVPSWFPGAGWKRHGEQLKAKAREVADEPFRRVRRELAAGNAPNCIATQLLEGGYSGFVGSEECQKWITDSIYGAAVDTTEAILRRFVYAMVVNPQVQRRAQGELDSITGGARLPTLEDLPSLPYLVAIIKECFRWQSSLPTALPHRLMQDDVYKGYLLRKGSMVLPNNWAIAHDPKLYLEPDTFDPERFMGVKPALDPRTYAFGMGRRICPGRDFTNASVFTTVSMLLASSTLAKAIDEYGNEIEPELITTGRFSNDLLPFPCRIHSRSSEMTALVLAELEATQ